jgi:excisionase family DNA binding protein
MRNSSSACALKGPKGFKKTVPVGAFVSYISNIAFTSFASILRFMHAAALKLPTPAASQEARVALRALAGIPKRKTPRTIQVKADDGGKSLSVTVPASAFELFLEVLGQMANGNAVTIVPVHAELTTQEAADVLNVSRPYLVRLLDEGQMPCRLVGTHRRIKMADLLTYKSKGDDVRAAVLEELAAEAQKHGLGY